MLNDATATFSLFNALINMRSSPRMLSANIPAFKSSFSFLIGSNQIVV